MSETPQTFASKAAIIEILKRAAGTALTRGELLDAASRELDASVPDDVARALDELKLEDNIQIEVVDGVERIKFAAAN